MPKPEGSKRINTVEDPGETGLAKVLSESGITLPAGSKPEPIVKPVISNYPIITDKTSTQLNHIKEALFHLHLVPVPKDLKQFKKVRKAIDLLESLGE